MQYRGGTLAQKGKKLLIFCSLLCMMITLYTPAPGAETTQLPSSFDLRNVNGINYVTPVRAQTGGTCWCHGALAAIESNLLMTGNWDKTGEIDDPNLAEYHLDWWNGFNQYNNDDTTPKTGGGLTVHQGGDYRITAAYLTRGDGPVFSLEANDETEYDANWHPSAPDRCNPSYQYYYVRDIEWYVAGKSLENIAIIKEKIMTMGALGTCMYVSGFDKNWTCYYPGNRDPTHAIAIVGWDDNRTIEGFMKPGAWLCKNSWGSSWGLDGYFWISYYDTHCCQNPEMGAVSFQNVEPLTYRFIYYHDYHGWRDTLTGCQKAFNAFTATDNHTLSAVSFYTAADEVDYTVKIYDAFDGNQLGTEMSSLSGHIKYSGFHTLDLITPIHLQKGDDFYIYLEVSQGGHPFDRTSEVTVLLGKQDSGIVVVSHANLGESYYYDGQGWIDLYTRDATANFCIKGLVQATPNLHCDGSLSWPRVSPGSKVTGSFTIENQGENLSFLSWRIEGYPTWGQWSFTPRQGDDLSPTDEPITVDVTIDIPDEQNTDFTGDIKIVNINNPDDHESISVSLSTAKKTTRVIPYLLEKLAEMFPLFDRLLALYHIS